MGIVVGVQLIGMYLAHPLLCKGEPKSFVMVIFLLPNYFLWA